MADKRYKLTFELISGEKQSVYIDIPQGDPGKDGSPGEDGITPHVGSNGNWFLGSTDTGVPATGPAGKQGLPGIPGDDGKSAYTYAQEAGYTGTEDEFAEKLAQEPSGSGIHIGTEAPTDPNVDVWIDTDEEALENENGIDVIAEVGQTIVVEAVDADGKPTAWKAVDFPTALKNPYALTINGTSYDGSKAVNIESIKGDTGQRGTGLLAVTSAPSSYTTAVGGITPKYRMALSTIKTQSGVTEVLLGDTIRSSYYHYPIAYLDASYAYFTTRTSIRGATGAAGAAGAAGADGKSAYAYAQDGGYTGTEEEFAQKLAEEYPTPDWNATEGESGHILNRTHYAEIVEKELLAEQEYSFAEGMAMFADVVPLEKGKTYKVSFDGVLYNCVAFACMFMDQYTIAIGNGAIFGYPVASNEPFAVATIQAAGMSGAMCTDTLSHTIKIAEDVEEVHTIPKKYIQNSIPFYVEIGSNYIWATPNEIKTALENGRAVIGVNGYQYFNLNSFNGIAVKFWTFNAGKIEVVTGSNFDTDAEFNDITRSTYVLTSSAN